VLRYCGGIGYWLPGSKQRQSGAVGSRRWKVKARLNLRVPQAVGRGAEAVGVLGGENPGSGAKFYAGLPLALSEPTHLSPGSWGLQP